MKKILIIILLIAMLPIRVFAETEASATGGQLLPPPPANGTAKSSTPSMNNCVYILYLAEIYGVYGLRITFYQADGTRAPALDGNGASSSVDVWRWNDNNPQGVYQSSTEEGFDIHEMREIRYSKHPYSKIDYINGSVFEYKIDTYRFYHDTEAAKFDPEKGDPLAYLAYTDRTFFKEYFTTESVVRRYAKLANANINFSNGKYFILLEPLLVLGKTTCSAGNGLGGRYTPAELGKLYEAGEYVFTNQTLRNVAFLRALRLEGPMQVGNMVFDMVSDFDESNSSTKFDSTYLTGKYGYGVAVVTGEEVCRGKCSINAYKVIYRTVDLANPFLGLDGEKRTLSDTSNWYGHEDDIELDIYEKEPIYTVTLTPSIIQRIREDNKTVNYTDILAKYSADSKFADSEFKKNFGL